MRGYERVDAGLQKLEAILRAHPLLKPDRINFDQAWSQIKMISREIKGVRYPSRQQHSNAVTRLEELVVEIKRREKLRSRGGYLGLFKSYLRSAYQVATSLFLAIKTTFSADEPQPSKSYRTMRTIIKRCLAAPSAVLALSLLLDEREITVRFVQGLYGWKALTQGWWRSLLGRNADYFADLNLNCLTLAAVLATALLVSVRFKLNETIENLFMRAKCEFGRAGLFSADAYILSGIGIAILHYSFTLLVIGVNPLSFWSGSGVGDALGVLIVSAGSIIVLRWAAQLGNEEKQMIIGSLVPQIYVSVAVWAPLFVESQPIGSSIAIVFLSLVLMSCWIFDWTLIWRIVVLVAPLWIVASLI